MFERQKKAFTCLAKLSKLHDKSKRNPRQGITAAFNTHCLAIRLSGIMIHIIFLFGTSPMLSKYAPIDMAIVSTSIYLQLPLYFVAECVGDE